VKIFHNWFRLGGTCIQPSLFKLDIRDYDIVHLHCYRSFQNVILSQKALKYHIPYIIDPHGSSLKFGRRLPKSLYDKVFSKLINGASKIILETNVSENEDWDKDKVEIIRSVFDVGEYSLIPQAGLFREKHNIKVPIILFVGRINKIKGLDFLLDSFSLFLKSIDARLVIVGQDDGYKSELEHRIYQLGISNKVLFTGFLSGDDKKSALVDADMLVQPSMYEAGARPSLEAIMCNTPVIVSRNTGAGREIKEMDAGYLVEYGDKYELCEAIRYVLDNENDVKEKTWRAKEYIESNLDLERQIDKYEKLYFDIRLK
jgi:glycosyltransferase involved in cell wall biosynthesis